MFWYSVVLSVTVVIVKQHIPKYYNSCLFVFCKILFVIWSSVLVQSVYLSDRFTKSTQRPPFAASRKCFGSGSNGFGVRLPERTSKLRMTVTRPAFTCISANRKPGTIIISGLNVWIERVKGIWIFIYILGKNRSYDFSIIIVFRTKDNVHISLLISQ